MVDEPDADAAEALLEQRLAAPTLWLAEAINALWTKCWGARTSPSRKSMKLALLARAPVAKIALDPLLPSTARRASALGHPVYDCFCLAAARP